MPRRGVGNDVFNEAIDRMVKVYEEGHEVVVGFSAGKDSGIILEICIIAATLTDRLPVKVNMRDEEIDLPGTYEYAERTAARPEIEFNWLYANQPIVNIYNRERPYFWVFDPQLDPDDWVRKPPPFARQIPRMHIEALTDPEDFDVPEGKNLIAVTGLRAQESRIRNMGIYSSGGYLTGADRRGVIHARPIYDWRDSDVWRAIKENGWDYNHAYDTLYKMGMRSAELRIAPPTQTILALKRLQLGAKAWPRWFDRVCNRLPGVRQVVLFGETAVKAERRQGESWETTYRRECINEAPDWIADRATSVMERFLSSHPRHSTAPFPEIEPCMLCDHNASWRNMTKWMWGGDPFSAKFTFLPNVEPEFFRPGAGTWQGKPTW